MRIRIPAAASLLLVLVVVCSPARAQDADSGVRYISDETAITLRDDKGLNAPVAALLKSGTRVELLQVDTASGYARVRVAQGREGWVLARYLSTEPAAREKLAAMQSKFAEQQALAHKLEAENERLRAAAAKGANCPAPVPAIECPAASEAASDGVNDDALPTKAPGEAVTLLTGAGLFIAGLLTGLLVSQLQGGGRRKKKWTPDL